VEGGEIRRRSLCVSLNSVRPCKCHLWRKYIYLFGDIVFVFVFVFVMSTVVLPACLSYKFPINVNPYLELENWNTESQYRILLQELLKFKEDHEQQTFHIVKGIWDYSYDTLKDFLSQFIGSIPKKRKKKKKRRKKKKKKKKKNRKEKDQDMEEDEEDEVEDPVHKVLKNVRYYYIITYWDRYKDEVIHFFKKNYSEIIPEILEHDKTDDDDDEILDLLNFSEEESSNDEDEDVQMKESVDDIHISPKQIKDIEDHSFFCERTIRFILQYIIKNNHSEK